MCDRHRLGAGKRTFATCGLVDDRAEREQITLFTVLAAAESFRGCVARGAQELPFLGEVCVWYAGDAEVRELHVPVLGDQ